MRSEHFFAILFFYVHVFQKVSFYFSSACLLSLYGAFFSPCIWRAVSNSTISLRFLIIQFSHVKTNFRISKLAEGAEDFQGFLGSNYLHSLVYIHRSVIAYLWEIWDLWAELNHLTQEQRRGSPWTCQQVITRLTQTHRELWMFKSFICKLKQEHAMKATKRGNYFLWF